MAQYDLKQLELVRSDLGDGGWSIHVRRTDIDEQEDPTGAWPIVGSGKSGEWSDRERAWMQPNKKDWASARAVARRLTQGRHHHATKRSSVQLQREIDKVLAEIPRGPHTSGSQAEATTFGTKWTEDRFREDPTYAAFTPEMVWIDPAVVPNAKKREAQKDLICSTAVKRWRELRDQALLSAAGHSQRR